MARKRFKVKICRSDKFTTLLVAVFLLLVGFALNRMTDELNSARAEQEFYAQRLAALQETNARLADDIANSDDPERIEDIARNDLGMTAEGEKIFRFRN